MAGTHALTPDDAEKLVKILALLGGDVAGEVLAAAAAATRFLRARNLEWPQVVLVAAPSSCPSRADAPKPTHRPRPEPAPDAPSWVIDATWCLAHPLRNFSLNSWEQEFCSTLSRALVVSEKQAARLAVLVGKLRTAERARAA